MWLRVAAIVLFCVQICPDRVYRRTLAARSRTFPRSDLDIHWPQEATVVKARQVKNLTLYSYFSRHHCDRRLWHIQCRGWYFQTGNVVAIPSAMQLQGKPHCPAWLKRTMDTVNAEVYQNLLSPASRWILDRGRSSDVLNKTYKPPTRNPTVSPNPADDFQILLFSQIHENQRNNYLARTVMHAW